MTHPTPSSPSLLRSLRGTGYRPPDVRVPAYAQVVEPDGRFAFEVPWPWYEIPPDELAGSSPLGSTADLAVVAPRTDGDDPVFALTVCSDQVDTHAASARAQGRSHAAAAGVRWRSTTKLLVGGAHALFTEGAPTGESHLRTFLLFAPCGENLVTGRCDVPTASADGYRQHLLSMLASWTWAHSTG